MSMAPAGWAEDTTCGGESKDYYYPNRRQAFGWYHDHQLELTSGASASVGQDWLLLVVAGPFGWICHAYRSPAAFSLLAPGPVGTVPGLISCIITRRSDELSLFRGTSQR